jgi:hypothetical protein
VTAVLGLLPSWAWRWLGIAAVAGSAALAFYWKGVEHEEVKFDDYRAQVKAAGDKQAELARQKEQAWKQLAEATEREAQLRTDRLAADLRAARLRGDALASRRLVPEPPGAAGGGGRICYAAEQLDRGLRQDLGGLQRRITDLAEQGQRDRDLAAECVAYVRGLQR